MADESAHQGSELLADLFVAAPASLEKISS